MSQKRIALIVGGGIAAYKCLELVRRGRERGFNFRVIMTSAAQKFVAPLSFAAVTGDRVYTNLFDLNDEHEIGHIRLARDTDLVVVAPATANLMARMTGGHADDLATAVLLATDKPVLIAPAMNPFMWQHAATQRNLSQLIADGVCVVGPDEGEMAEVNEAGVGRMVEPAQLLEAITTLLNEEGRELIGRHVLVTAGPTFEPIDPVRYIANRSSGTQGYAIAAAAAARGASVTLVSGPTNLAPPRGTTLVQVETANQMLEAVKTALPADIAIFAAAVSDWRVTKRTDQKIKKRDGQLPTLEFVENPDILRYVASCHHPRPKLVIGFAAETENVIVHAREKLAKKQCDWIVANDVSTASGVMGGTRNAVHIVAADGVESWPELDKTDVAARLVARAAAEVSGLPTSSRI